MADAPQRSVPEMTVSFVSLLGALPFLSACDLQPAFEMSPASTLTESATTAEPFTTRTRAADGGVMVYVPAGRFTMGGDEKDPEVWDGEVPAHSVYLDAFWQCYL